MVGTVAELRLDIKYLMISSYFSDLFLELVNPLSCPENISCDVAEGASWKWLGPWWCETPTNISIDDCLDSWKKKEASLQITLAFHQDSISHLLEIGPKLVWKHQIKINQRMQCPCFHTGIANTQQANNNNFPNLPLAGSSPFSLSMFPSWCHAVSSLAFY